MNKKTLGLVLGLTLGSLVTAQPGMAQSIRSAEDGTNTRVRVEGDRYRITGGQTSGDGANLFHSFEAFGLTAEEIAVFRSRAEVENILGRINGGDASYINGLLRVLGGDANLFLMNPAGIVFGENARLDLGGSFTATTATGIGFENGWFNVVGTPDYASLVGAPNGYTFAVGQPGAIANYGNLSVDSGNIPLLAGTVVNTGSLSVPNGDLTLTAVPGSSRVQLTQEGSLLSLELETTGIQQLVENPLALPELLTGGSIAPPEQFTVENNRVLVGNGIAVNPGDVAIAPTQPLQAQNGSFTATENLTLLDATLEATENLSLQAGNTVLVRDSEAAPLRAIAGDRLRLQGNQTVDIFALTHPNSGLFSGGAMVLRSPNPVLGDAHYFSGGNFRIERPDGNLGSLFSPFDPVIRSQGDISFQSYQGASLHVIAGGQVRIPGTITIIGADGTNGLAERITLSDGTSILVDGINRPTLDIRAGVANVNTTQIIGEPSPPGLNLNPGAAPSNANIFLGAINMSVPNSQIFLSTQYQPNTSLSGGSIRLRDSAPTLTGNGGDIIIDARNSVQAIQGLNTSNPSGTAGNVLVLADEDISISNSGIQTSGLAAGDVQLRSRRGDVTINGGIEASSAAGQGGNILVNGPNSIRINGNLSTRATGTEDRNGRPLNSGNIVLESFGTIRIGDLNTTSNRGRGGSVSVFSIFSSIATGAINTQGTIGGAVRLNALEDVTFGSITTGANLSQVGGNIFLTGFNISGNALTASAQRQGGTISVAAEGAVALTNATAEGNEGGALSISAATTEVNNVDVSGSTQGGSIEIASDTVRTGNLAARAPRGLGGTIQLNSLTELLTGNISVEGETGGELELLAGTAIATGQLSSAGTVGDGGAVFLESTGRIEIGAIDARGGAAGQGGAVEVTASEFVRVLGTVFDESINAPASITASGSSGGSIVINHGGSSFATPFTVGDPSLNGTAGAITTGEDTLFPGEGFESNVIRGNLSILTTEVDELPPDGEPDREGENQFNAGEIDDFDDDEDFEEDEDWDELDEELDDELDEFDDLLFLAAETVPLDNAVFSDVEGDFSGEFTDYLDVTEPAIASVDDARTTLNAVNQATGLSPALLYINFVPVVVGSNNPDLEQLELVLVTSGENPVRKRVLGATRSQVMEVARQFRQEVTNPIRTRTTSYLPHAQQLYNWLIAPLEEELQAEGVENISFVLAAGLRSLPIAALHDGEGFLVERYSVGLMPSLSLVDTRFRNIQDNQVLAMGAAQFADQFPLPAVPFEVNGIANDIWEGEAFLNEEFTLNTLLQERRDTPFGIVHLATHGEFRPGELSNSYIQFWDQRLQLDQLRQLNLNNPPVNLLVLSACRMALGDTQAELGFAGLAVQAGVQTALASLWYVSDAGTLALMTEFYRALQDNPTKAEALRRAQLAMIRGEVQLEGDSLMSRGVPAIALPSDLLKGESPNLAHPYYWSAFTLIGSPW